VRSVGEILEAAKSGGQWPTHEECFWAMQALEQAWLMTSRKYREQVFTPKRDELAKTLCENDFQMGKRLMAADPKVWLGPDRDYSKPENRKRREIAVKLFDKACEGELPNQKRAPGAGGTG
jgi:hypothetical protein